MMLFVGALTIAVLGWVLGSLTTGLADYIRCRSVGNEWAVQNLVCPRWNLSDWLDTPLRLCRVTGLSMRERIQLMLPAGILAVVWVAFFFRYATGAFTLVDFFVLLVWQWALLLFAVTDAKWRILPVEAMVLVGILVAGLRLFNGSLSITSCLLGILFGVLFFGTQYWFSRGRWLGAGDPWMAAMIGAVLGWPMVGVSVYFTYVFGIFIIAWALSRRTLAHRLRYPFGPLLAAGAVGALLFGPTVLQFLHR